MQLKNLVSRCAVRCRVLVALLAAWPLSGCEELRSLIESISDGAACTTSAQCLGGVCLSTVDGYPEGYCSTTECDSKGCSNIFGSECLVLGNASAPFCYNTCEADTDCRSGYSCFSIETARVCLPVSFEADFAQAGSLGSACTNDSQCDAGTCLTNYVGGYCSVVDCAGDAACGSGRCLELDAGEGSGASSVAACFRSCTNDSACRFGYRCQDPDGQGGACVEIPRDEQSPVRNPNGRADGETCTVDINCKGGTCLRAAEGYPDGYCTTLDCSSIGCNSPAGKTSTCSVITEETACYVECGAASDCRTGYECAGADTGSGFCQPPVDSQSPTDAGELEIVCESRSAVGGRALSFNIAPSTVSFAIVPFSDRNTVRPSKLYLPDGTIGADFDDNYAFLDVNPSIIGNIAPVFFPAAPQFESLVQQGGGNYVLDLGTSAADPCYFVAEKSAPGTTLDVNIYFVGVDGITAATAPSNSGYTAMVSKFQSIYRSAGITVNSPRLFDAPTAAADAHKIIRDLNQLSDLVKIAADTEVPEFSIDVFLINGFAVPQAPGLLGISLGIPGIPAVHGVMGSGLVFTAEYLSEAAAQTGQTLAHEIGHFNGLRHTSEHGGEDWDPIADTAQCSNPDRGTSCPDARNLMFPFSLGDVAQETVSANQAFVLRASPHVR